MVYIYGSGQPYTCPSPSSHPPLRTFPQNLPHEQTSLQYPAALSKQNTIMRSAIPIAKWLAVFLDWAGSGSPHQTLPRTMLVKLQFATFMKLFSFWGAAARRGLPVGVRPLPWSSCWSCSPAACAKKGLQRIASLAPPSMAAHYHQICSPCCWTQEPLSPEYHLPNPLAPHLPNPLALYLFPFFL